MYDSENITNQTEYRYQYINIYIDIQKRRQEVLEQYLLETISL